MYWDRTHEAAIVRKAVTGSGEDTMVGHARDFAALLEASVPLIQPDELIVGCCLALPEDQDSIDLGRYDPHYPPGHATILRLGLKGIRDEAAGRCKEELDPARKAFLKAVEISYGAACRYVEKYAELAESMAASECDSRRWEELAGISAVCRELATGRPTSFHAALQLVQFTRVFGGYGCVGRFDQWLYPFYRRDVEIGRLTREKARELLECLFVKINHFADIADLGSSVYIKNDTLRNITLAGQTPDGEDACNELTLLCLEASAGLMLPEPKLNVRFFSGSPPALLRECCRILAKGANVLAVFNDEVAVPALRRLGIPLEDARDYCNDGCSELIVGGKCTLKFRTNDSLPVLNETVLEAENGGYERFPDLLEDFKSRLTRYMPRRRSDGETVSFPYFAASIEDCLAKASPKAARYGIYGSILAQVGNSADGLAAIKKLVYDDGSLAWNELVRAMRVDFEGYERLRQMLRNRAPKYGNDDDFVDSIAGEVAEWFCDGVHERARNPEGPGVKSAAGLMSFGIHRRSSIAASPDGRRKGDLTANSYSPSVGMDRSGPTAVLNSVSKADLTKASHGSVVDLALHSSLVRGGEAFDKFVDMVATFLEMHSAATLQINVIDRNTLLKARADPDDPRYRTLIVRVWGFSAVFVDLPAGLQDHVISRTEHGLDR